MYFTILLHKVLTTDKISIVLPNMIDSLDYLLGFLSSKPHEIYLREAEIARIHAVHVSGLFRFSTFLVKGYTTGGMANLQMNILPGRDIDKN